MLKGRILVHDHLNRWSMGEVGELQLSSDLKHDYCVTLQPTIATETCTFFKKGDRIARAYYFHRSEVEVIKDDT